MSAPHPTRTTFVERAADAAVIAAALWVAATVRGVVWSDRYGIAAIVAVLVFHAIGEGFRLYRPERHGSALQSPIPLVMTVLWTVFALLALAWMTKSTGHYSRVAIGLWAVFAVLGLFAWRMAWHLGHGRMRPRERVAIAGAGPGARQLAHVVCSTPSLGLTLAGFFAERAAGDDEQAGDPLPAPLHGDLDALVEHARANAFDRVFIAMPLKAEDRIHRLVTALSDTTTPVYIVPDLFVHELAHARWLDLGPFQVISVFETPFGGIDGWVKRLEDLVLSVLILIAAAAPMLAIAAAVKLTSSGPVLFAQRRHGFDGREIVVWKFRTMIVAEDGEDCVQAAPADPRLTPIGAFLRRRSLDELPQFFNVLHGDMSIVGPRPHAVAHNERYRRLIPGYMLRHRVKPGITGWAQIHGLRGRTDTIERMGQRVRYDLWYIRRWSVWLDLWIIARTIGLMAGDENAW